MSNFSSMDSHCWRLFDVLCAEPGAFFFFSFLDPIHKGKDENVDDAEGADEEDSDAYVESERIGHVKLFQDVVAARNRAEVSKAVQVVELRAVTYNGGPR
mmetsp:Transcript_9724/g.13570  ORF Transcript_9724/g.13570 Transcript_9724/m.13570 type:complete len:100 (-) Transcript_9724:2034-2333(-)